jgi:hypothetical protein
MKEDVSSWAYSKAAMGMVVREFEGVRRVCKFSALMKILI